MSQKGALARGGAASLLTTPAPSHLPSRQMPASSHVLAATIPAPNEPVRVTEFARPTLEPRAALLHVLFSEVCGTDVHLHHGKLAGVTYPLIPGHVSVGVIAELR